MMTTEAAPDLFMEAMTAAMAVEAPAEEAPVQITDTPADNTEVATTPTADKVEVAPEAAPRPAAEAPPIANERFAPRLQKLMEREATTVAREQQLKAQEAKYAALEAQLAEMESAKAQFLANPTAFIRKLAPDAKPADLAKALWYEELGDAAPIEHRLSKAERAAKQSEQAIRAELEQERQRAAEAKQHAEMEAAHHQYVGALSAVARAVPDTLPLVKAFSQKDPERVTRGLYRMAQKHARATNGEVATPEQCAEMLQRELASVADIYGQPAPAAKPAPAPAAVTNPPSSLRNKHTTTQPNKTGAPSEDELFQEAVKAAQEAATRL